ncbi:MAG: hypothetical protein ABIG43_00420 [Chloroflexota bacterium]
MIYLPLYSRYENMPYQRCCKSGWLLARISMGFWHNFGGGDTLENAHVVVRRVL